MLISFLLPLFSIFSSRIKLSDYVKSLPEQLETLLTGKDIVLTPGLRQLFSLGRAILRNRSIVVLDESSSSMDNATDQAMQQVMVSTSNKFRTLVRVDLL